MKKAPLPKYERPVGRKELPSAHAESGSAIRRACDAFWQERGMDPPGWHWGADRSPEDVADGCEEEGGGDE